MPPRRTLTTTLLLLALAPPLGAIDLIPNRYDDPPPNGCNPGDCSFREAVIAANDAAGADRVILSTGTYRLTLPGVGDVFSLTGSVDVRDTLEIAGAGASLTFIEAPGLSEQVLFAPLASIAMTLRGVTVQLADKEGMVLLADGPNVIEDCQFRNNASTGAFGGLEVHNSGSTTIRRSAFIGNGGPGLFIVSGTADIETSPFRAARAMGSP